MKKLNCDPEEDKKILTIDEVCQKVTLWRKLYKGITLKDEKTGQDVFRNYSLEEAADTVGISKKTLDDYLLQIRIAKQHNFDFAKNRDQSIGVMRAFNRKK